MTFSRGWRRLISTTVFPVALACALAGCGQSTATVTGKVSYKDQIVKGGIVILVAEGKSTTQGAINEDGSYTVKDVPTGPVKVCVDTSSMNPAKISKVFKYSPPKDAKAPEGFGSGPDVAELKRRYVQIPDRYADPSKTTLTTTVTGGTYTYDIKLDP